MIAYKKLASYTFKTFGSLTDLIIVESRVLGSKKRMVALAIQNERIWWARRLVLLDNWVLRRWASLDDGLMA